MKVASTDHKQANNLTSLVGTHLPVPSVKMIDTLANYIWISKFDLYIFYKFFINWWKWKFSNFVFVFANNMSSPSEGWWGHIVSKSKIKFENFIIFIIILLFALFHYFISSFCFIYILFTLLLFLPQYCKNDTNKTILMDFYSVRYTCYFLWF